jgi:hypothetical protein
MITPPATILCPIASYILQDFHKEHYVLSWCPSSVLVCDASNTFKVWPTMLVTGKRAKCKYYLYKKEDQSKIYLRCGVYDSSCSTPPHQACNRIICGWSFSV